MLLPTVALEKVAMLLVETVGLFEGATPPNQLVPFVHSEPVLFQVTPLVAVCARADAAKRKAREIAEKQVRCLERARKGVVAVGIRYG